MTPGTSGTAGTSVTSGTSGTSGTSRAHDLGGRERSWHHRRTLLAAGAVVAVLGVSVLSDLPRTDTPALRRQDLAGFVTSLGAQVAQCSAGVHDALAAYGDATASPPKLPMSTAASYVQDGIDACSFINSGVVGLSSQQAPRTVLGLGVGSLPAQVGLWASFDAFSMLQDLKVVVAHPGDAAARRRYLAQVSALDQRRARVEQIVTSAEARAGAPRSDLALTEVLAYSVVGGAQPR